MEYPYSISVLNILFIKFNWTKISRSEFIFQHKRVNFLKLGGQTFEFSAKYLHKLHYRAQHKLLQTEKNQFEIFSPRNLRVTLYEVIDKPAKSGFPLSHIWSADEFE